MELKNFVGIFDNAVTPEYCKKAIDFYKDSKEAGFALDRQTREAEILKIQKDDTSIFLNTSSIMELKACKELCTGFNDAVWECYRKYVDNYQILKVAAPHTNYHLKMQKTEIGQGYHAWHFEDDGRAYSQRLLVYSLYLNDVEEGGETEFLYYPMRVKPKEGTMLIWPAGFTHTHRGNPPISNSKYIITGWIEF